MTRLLLPCQSALARRHSTATPFRVTPRLGIPRRGGVALDACIAETAAPPLPIPPSSAFDLPELIEACGHTAPSYPPTPLQ